MKGLELIKRLVVIILAILIFAMAFLGIYAKDKGVWVAKLKGYNYGMDFNGYRELRYTLDDSEATEKEYYVDENGKIMGEVVTDNSSLTGNTEINLVDDAGNPIVTDDATGADKKEDDPTSAYKKEKRMVSPNPAEVRTPENYEKTKKILQKRLENLNGYEYNLRVDNETGDIVLEVPDNEDDILVQKSIVSTKGNLQIIDSQTGLVLLDSDKIQSATAVQGLDSETGNAYQMYITIQYKKDAIETLREISTKYVKEETKAQDENAEAEEGSAEDNIKTVKIMLDGTALRETYFGDELKDGTISIPVGEASSDLATFEQTRNQVAAMASTITGESLPLEYKLVSDNFKKSDVTETTKKNIKMIFAIVVVAISAALIIKYKMNGAVAAALGLMYSGVISLIFRYTNVYVTLNSACTFGLVLCLNYYLLFKILNYSNDGKGKESLARAIKEYYLMTIPVWIVGLVFTFAYGVAISSIGMVAFWGMFVQLVGIGIVYALDII